MMENGKKTGARSSVAVCFVALAVLSCRPAAPASAAVPSEINYQGKLSDSSGNPLTGVYSFMFRLCADSNCNTVLMRENWDKTTTPINVVNGIYSVQIGSYVPVAESVFDGSAVYLEINVESGSQAIGAACGSPCETLLPRAQVTSVGYALHAVTAEQLGTGGVVSTHTAQGDLQMARNLFVQQGYITTGSSVNASSFWGDGSHLTGIVAAPNGAVGGDLAGTLPNPTLNAASTHTWTGTQNFISSAGMSVAYGLSAGSATIATGLVAGGTVTVQGNAFSVGGSSFTVQGGSATVAYQLGVGSLCLGGVCNANWPGAGSSGWTRVPSGSGNNVQLAFPATDNVVVQSTLTVQGTGLTVGAAGSNLQFDASSGSNVVVRLGNSVMFRLKP